MAQASVNVLALGAQTASGSALGTFPGENTGGVFYLSVVGAPTGTTPTLTAKIQELNPVSGNFVDVPGAVFTSGNITAAGDWKLVIHPAATASANAVVANSLGRTFQVVWTIGGTTPSFNMGVIARSLA